MEEAGIYARESAYLDRWVQFGAAGEKIVHLSFPSAPDDDVGDDHSLLDRIDAYLEGDEDSFDDVDVGLTVPTAHRAVLERTREIPYGDQLSVARLAAMTPDLDPDDEDDLATVREALAENPVPLLVPDHRVRDGPSGAPPDVEQKLRSIEGL